MPEKKTRERAARAKREGKAPSTQAGAFVEEEIEHVREGKHGARSTTQAIAIGLSKARRAGIAVPQRAGTRKTSAQKTAAKKATKKAAKKATAKKKAVPRRRTGSPSAKRSRATTQALKREGRAAGSHAAVSRQAHAAARKRSAASRSAAAKKAARTKGERGRSVAARKAARTRARRSR